MDRPARVIGDLTVRIDRTLCVGFGDCLDHAPDAFALDDDNVVVFTETGSATAEELHAACAACPVDALTLMDANGTQLAP